jgi:hypothetical protein
MQELPFVIPLTGIVRIDGGEITIVVNRTETGLNFVAEAAARHTALKEGLTLNDIVLEAAREIVAEKGYNRFHAAEIFHKALEKHPGIKRNSLMSRVVACTPDHPSNKHFASRRDFFRYGGSGLFLLNEQYMPNRNVAGMPSKSR